METCKTLQEIKMEMKKPQHPLEVSLNYKETLKFLCGEKSSVLTNRRPNAITKEQKLQCGQNRKRAKGQILLALFTWVKKIGALFL